MTASDLEDGAKKAVALISKQDGGQA